MMPFRVRIVRQAVRQIEEAAAWWTANRPAVPRAIQEELRAAVELVARHPSIGARALGVRLPGVRRILLSRVRYHVYYRVRVEAETVEILAFWHASRGMTPNI